MALAEEDIKQAMAEYVAGDLTQQETKDFEHFMAENPAETAKKQAFWQTMLPALATHGRPQAQAYDPALAEKVRASLVQREKIIVFPQWLRYAGSAVAASLLTVLAFNALPSIKAPLADTGHMALIVEAADATDDETVAYNEHGAAVTVPRTGAVLNGTNYLQYHKDENTPLMGVHTAAHIPVSRPYIGFLIRPITIDGSEHSTGALVLQVTAGSPAAATGISPGDILLKMAACPMATRYCVPHALDGRKPGDSVTVKFWDQSTNTVVVSSLTLGATNE